MAFLTRKVLGVEVMKEEKNAAGTGEATHVSADVLVRNDDFRQFAERMKASGKVYFLLSDNGTTRQLSCEGDNELPAGGDAQAAEKEWLDCCLRDFLQRKQRFGKRCGSRLKVIVRILAYLLPVLALLWWFWPLWDFLIDVDTEVYFRTLEIKPTVGLSEVKRAYRRQVTKWHPDRNPGCGEPCRAQMRRIQQAHDVLMARGDHSAELANRYRDELLQVRSFVFFRVYEMASNAAQELFNVIAKIRGGSQMSDSTAYFLRVGSSISTILFFTVYETLYIGGFSPMMIIQVFFFVVSMVSSAKRESYIARARKAAYVDILPEAAVLILPLALTGYWSVLTQTDSADHWEGLFRVTFGCFYVAAYLYRFTPNVYDNLCKRSCTVTTNYFRVVTEHVVTPYSVGMAELGFLVDDLFAFTCRVPSAFRLVVFVSHFVYLCQFAMLPWEGPLRAQNTNEVQRKGAHDCEKTSDMGRATNVSSSPMSSTKPAARFLSKKDLRRVTGLDNTLVNWRLVATAPYYNVQLQAAIKSAQKNNNGSSLAPSIAACGDFESVAVIVAVPDAGGAAAPGATVRGKLGLKHELVCLVKDVAACRMLALNSGPMGMVPTPNAPRDINTLRIEYAKVFGDNAKKTVSMIWRSRVRPPVTAKAAGPKVPTSDISVLLALTSATAALLFLFLSGCAVKPFDVFCSTAIGLPKTMQPFAHLRFPNIFAPEHPINSMAVGLVTFLSGRLTLCTVDPWDAAHQFQLYKGR